VSQENEQIVRRGFDLWNLKDFGSLAEIFHPDLEIEFLWNGNRALIETRVRARGKGSGIQLAETYYTIWTIEDGKGTVLELHIDPAAAYESAGLSAHLERDART
jgi:ketosteroid isomerase-like protein